MRRDFDMVRNILLNIGDGDAVDTKQIAASFPDYELPHINYHVQLLTSSGLVAGQEHRPRESFGWGSDVKPDDGAKPWSVHHWYALHLTWAGNDFLDMIADEKSWKRFTKSLASGAKAGAKAAAIEGIRALVSGSIKVGIGMLLMDGEDDARLEVSGDLPQGKLDDERHTTYESKPPDTI